MAGIACKAAGSVTPWFGGAGMQWLRIVVFAVAILFSVTLVGFASGLSMGYWEIYGPTIGQAIDNSRLVRRLAANGVAMLLYWWFACGVSRLRLLQVLAVFVLMQALDAAQSLAFFKAAPHDLFDSGALLRGLIAALLGYALARLGFLSSSTPPPSRDTA